MPVQRWLAQVDVTSVLTLDQLTDRFYFLETMYNLQQSKVVQMRHIFILLNLCQLEIFSTLISSATNSLMQQVIWQPGSDTKF